MAVSFTVITTILPLIKYYGIV